MATHPLAKLVSSMSLLVTSLDKHQSVFRSRYGNGFCGVKVEGTR